MPIYRYEGTTPDGDQITGTIPAPSRMLATVKLRQKGLSIHRLVPVDNGGEQRTQPTVNKVHQSPWYPLRPISLGALGNFYAQLHELLRAGVSLHDSATALQTRVHPRLRKVLEEVAPALAEGEGLAENLAKYPQIFPAHVRAMVKVGETAGNLDEICATLSSQYDDEQRLAQMLLLPKLYYGIVLLFCILIPTFPWMISRGLSWYFHQLITILIPVIAAILMVILLVKVLRGYPAAKGLTDDITWRLPWLAPFGSRAARARMLSSLHILMRAGVDLPTAMELAAPASGLRPMKSQMQIAAQRIKQQVPVAMVLEECSAFGDREKNALLTAQQSGLYENALESLAQRAVEERESAIQKIAVVGMSGSGVIAAVVVGIALYFGYSNYVSAILERAEEWMP